jgi:hypothetical protein
MRIVFFWGWVGAAFSAGGGSAEKINRIPCVVYITSRTFTPILRELWLRNMKGSQCTLRFFNDTEILRSAADLGIANEVTSVRPWAFKVDLWRYAQLIRFGGIFFDAELRLHTLPERIFNLNVAQLQLPVDRNRECLFNAMMAAPRYSVALQKILARALMNVRKRSYGHADSRAEPWLGIIGLCTAGKAVGSESYVTIGRHISPHTINNAGVIIATSVDSVKSTFTNSTSHYGYYWGSKTVYV